MTQSGSRRDRPSFEFPATISLTIWHLHLQSPFLLHHHAFCKHDDIVHGESGKVPYLVDLIMSGWQQTACKCRSGQVFSFVPQDI